MLQSGLHLLAETEDVMQSLADLALDDDGGNCRGYSCGARGGYHGEGFPIKSRRTVKYLKLVMASREFSEAVDEFQKDHPPGTKP